MAEISTADQNDLPDSAFAYIEPGGSKDSEGKTTPRSLRHFPVQDAAHVRNALSRAPQSPFGEKAMPKIRAAAERLGVDVSSDSDSDSRSYEWLPLTTGAKPELRGLDESGAQRIGGYAAVFDKLSKTLRQGHSRAFVEKVAHGAFNECRSRGWPDVMCRFNHKDEEILGRTPKTLELRTDGMGLDYTVTPPGGHRIVEQVRRGDIAASSFAFYCSPEHEEWGLSDTDFPMRTLHQVELIDVAPVTTPAYPDATAGLRSLAQHFGADLAEVRSMADAGELRKFFIRTDNQGQAPKPRPVAAALLQLMDKRIDPWDGRG